MVLILFLDFKWWQFEQGQKQNNICLVELNEANPVRWISYENGSFQVTLITHGICKKDRVEIQWLKKIKSKAQLNPTTIQTNHQSRIYNSHFALQ